MQNRLLKWIIGHYSKDAIKGSLHLRRGDSINDCDRSVDEMRDYLACSLDGTESLGRNLTMTFMTDESDTKYRTKHHGFIG
jgi:alkyl sulfatase BDS1-like metallo-beta-lactamase superfamily hydrolase